MPIYKTSREEIIKKSFKVFLEKGYYHTTVSDLSKACQIEKSHFYYYFESKNDLMFSALGFIKVWASENLFVHAGNQQVSPSARMKDLLDTLKEIHSKGFAGCIFGNTALETANNDETFAPVIKEYFALWKAALVKIYIEKFNKQESEQRAARFLNELNGALLMMKVYKDTSYLQDFISNHINEV
jgi:TetR/AcrR family transcriptional regulator, transcriptional repressor for nem operon